MMTLFEEEKIGIVPDLNNWVQFFNYEDIIGINRLISKVNKMRKYKTIYPSTHNVLRIFKDLNPRDVKVVILGQDPYHNGNANGYAFGVRLNLSPSLSKIWEAICEDTSKTLIDDKAKPDLSYLVKQGVMLLNTTLTVEKGKANSHRDLGWKKYMQIFIANFSNQYPNVVYLLWGNDAKEFSKCINPVKNKILFAPHPAYASYQNIKWDCNHFSKANEYLESKNKLKINWR